jgi:hypothetical protein
MAVGLSACVGDLDVKPIDPNVKQEFDQDAVFAKIYATLGLTGQRGPADDGDVDGIDEGTSSFYRMSWSLNEFPTDEVWWVWPDAGIPDINSLSWSSSNNLVTGLYYRLYFDITLCNLFLEETDGQSDAKTTQQRTEVRFLRALNYYQLLDMYGSGVPFAQKVGEIPMPITRAQLFDWLVLELTQMEPLLPADGTKLVYYRVDQVAAWLLLARIYLNAEVYTGTPDWSNAALWAGKAMASSYELAPVYKHLFMADNDKTGAPLNLASREIVLPIAQDGIETQSWGGSLFLLASPQMNGMNYNGSSAQWACFRSKTNLVEQWFSLTAAASIKADENAMPAIAGDDRCLLVSEVKDADGNATYQASLTGGAGTGDAAFITGWGIAKFKNIYVSGAAPRNSEQPDMDIPYLRLAEAYLTYAEAVTRGGTATNGTALDAVNALRNRAHATPWTAADLTLDNLLAEWSREFYAEGRRRSDLVRFNKFAGNVSYNWEGKGKAATGTNVDAKHNVYPIPYSDLTANANLSPTEGY